MVGSFMQSEAAMDASARREDAIFLTCEKYRIFELLICAAGMMGQPRLPPSPVLTAFPPARRRSA